MRDVGITRKAGAQFNRISREQLTELGYTRDAIAHRLATGRLVIVDQGVFAVPPVLDDDWGRWMGATLTAPGTFLSRVSAAAARKFWSARRDLETVTRHGDGGPRRHDRILVFRSTTLEGDTEVFRGIPITTVARTLLDLAATRTISDKAFAWALREALRFRLTSLAALVEYTTRNQGRRGTTRFVRALARYSGLPVERARSGVEILAMEILRDARFVLPGLNVRRAGQEADLSWPTLRLIIEVDGEPFHLDRGEDARKQRIWEEAGWTVRRISSDDIHEIPERLIALVAGANVPRYAL